MDKVARSPAQAVADIGDGSSVAIAGFGIGHRFPSSLIRALRDRGSKDLCIVCNSLGAPGQLRAQILVENHQVKKLVAAFSARPGMHTEAERQLAAGELEVELVPQGTLVERLRAGGAGIPAFYTPTAVGTDIASGKEHRTFKGETFILEEAIQVDFAFLRAMRGDRIGNLEFRGASQNFNPSFAKAAKVAIAEVDEIVEVGELAPERVHLPGIFVSRVVESTVNVELSSLSGRRRRDADASRMYNGRTALTRTEVARRAAMLLDTGSYVNLGTGMPTLLSNYAAERGVVMHAENGILGFGPLVEIGEADPDYFNAGGGFVSLMPGACFFESVTSFEMARSGKLNSVVLGAYQVDEHGNLANWSTRGMAGGGIGGAMDIVAGGATVIIVMEHTDSRGAPKLVRECDYPLTGTECVDVVVTDLAMLLRGDEGFVLTEVARGFSVDEVLALTPMRVEVAREVRTMQDSWKTA